MRGFSGRPSVLEMDRSETGHNAYLWRSRVDPVAEHAADLGIASRRRN